jgi:hypothetical protein
MASLYGNRPAARFIVGGLGVFGEQLLLIVANDLFKPDVAEGIAVRISRVQFRRRCRAGSGRLG